MNKISVQKILTPYGHEEDCLVIDDIPIALHLEKCIKNLENESLNTFDSLLGLYPAWGVDLVLQSERRFVWTLILRDEPTNLPILVCEDDLDLSCIVIVVAVRKEGEYIYWDKIGKISHENYNKQIDLQRGILHLESYTDEDWDKYGDNIATAKLGSSEWDDWISKNWSEENYRRLMNYSLSYYHDNNNVVWLGDLNFIFTKKEYDLCISHFKQNES